MCPVILARSLFIDGLLLDAHRKLKKALFSVLSIIYGTQE